MKIDPKLLREVAVCVGDRPEAHCGVEWLVYRSWKSMISHATDRSWTMYPDLITYITRDIDEYIKVFRDAGFTVFDEIETDGFLKGKRKVTVTW